MSSNNKQKKENNKEEWFENGTEVWVVLGDAGHIVQNATIVAKCFLNNNGKTTKGYCISFGNKDMRVLENIVFLDQEEAIVYAESLRKAYELKQQQYYSDDRQRANSSRSCQSYGY